ncbi:unnamed protein product [Rotaria sp. Silwood1]|nr:unnamed protein product [Rotaria sp. Silwood1]
MINEKKAGDTDSSSSSSTTTTTTRLIYNTKERVCTTVPAIPTYRLDIGDLFSNPSDSKDKPNLDVLKQHILLEGRLTEQAALRIIETGTTLLREEPTLLNIDTPLTICGDIHGQFYDLMKLFEIGGSPSDTRYLFLGDYVDRGYFGIECVLYLWSLKINYPQTFFLLRGNHECRHLTNHFTFKQECIVKYTEKIYNSSMEAFDCLPLAALVNNQLLCVHAGLSPEIYTLDDIKQLDRFREPPTNGAMCDLLWSDPAENYGNEEGLLTLVATPRMNAQEKLSSSAIINSSESLYLPNTARGCSYFYTYAAINEFLIRNQILSVIRAHEAQDLGFRMYKKSSNTEFPSLITIFSAPNYCDVYENKAAIIKYENNIINIHQFNYSLHPYWLPNFMNIFTWSLPCVCAKVNDILLKILNICSGEELNQYDEHFYSLIENNQIEQRKEQIRSKIRAVGKVAKIYKKLCQLNENVISLHGLTPSTSIIELDKDITDEAELAALILCQKAASAKEHFSKVKVLDQVNERLPSPRKTIPSADPNVTVQEIVNMICQNYAAIPPSSLLRRSSTLVVDLPIVANEKSTSTKK